MRRRGEDVPRRGPDKPISYYKAAGLAPLFGQFLGEIVDVSDVPDGLR